MLFMEEEGEDPVARLARERFGVPWLYPLQRLAVANVLDAAESEEGETGRQLVLLPTGAGKSLCFQLPALALPRPTIVVYPLLALMEDQRRSLARLGIPYALFRGGQEEGERRAAMADLESGRAKLAITNPESLRSRDLLDFLASLKPSHLAVDEAHCVSEWGETFRPAYLELGEIAERLAPRALSAFTATASPSVVEALERLLFRGEGYRLVSGDPDRPNLSYSVARTLSRNRSLERLCRGLPKPLIVFVSSRAGAEILAELLRARLGSEDIRFYHAGLGREEKREVEAWFYGSATGILCATSAYGMGVDKRDIRSVVHYEAPASVEAYLQEAGRAGRDGLPSRAVLVAGRDDGARLGREADPGRRARRAALLAYAAGEGGCRRESLLRLLGAEPRGPCSGCDRCEGSAEEGFEGGAELAAFARLNSRRFSEKEALDLLLGTRGLEPPLAAGSGSMEGWRREDAASALRAAAELGLIRLVGKGPWKGKLAGPRRGPRQGVGPSSRRVPAS